MRRAEPLTVWRLVAERHAASAFDGEGARLYGGRWNHPGTAVIYASATLSLAALELLVHLEVEDAPEDRVAVAAELPARLEVETIRETDLPESWRTYPAPEALKDLGSAWAQAARSAVLEVPSAVIPEERNHVLNPRHPDFAEIRLLEPAPFILDRRLWKAGGATGSSGGSASRRG